MSVRSKLKEELDLDYDELSYEDKLYVFMDLLVDFGKITEEDLHMFFAKYFNIPNCCAQNFSDLISQNIDPWAHMVDHHNHPKGPVKYVMCQKCIKENAS